MEFFSSKYSTFLQKIVTASLQKVTRRNITNHSLEKKKALCFDILGSKTTFFPVFSV